MIVADVELAGGIYRSPRSRSPIPGGGGEGKAASPDILDMARHDQPAEIAAQLLAPFAPDRQKIFTSLPCSRSLPDSCAGRRARWWS